MVKTDSSHYVYFEYVYAREENFDLVQQQASFKSLSVPFVIGGNREVGI